MEERFQVMEQKTVNIEMDYREKGSGIGEILTRQYGVTPTIRQLNSGDYIINKEIAVERKTTLDFAQSIIDGRLFKQAVLMKRLFDFSAFIIEGKNLYNTSVDIHPHSIKGALISIALVWHIPVLISEDVEDSASLLWLLAAQDVKIAGELTYRSGRRPKQIRRRQLYILQGLPHVGPALALRMLEHFGSVEAAICAKEEELMQIPKLGKLKAKKIRDVISKSNFF